jgi:toxin-antitoxin system PIN domain toxin
MNVLDVNVLLAAFREEHPAHERATGWISGSIETGEPFTVPGLVWVGFMRMATNRRVFAVPATFDQAWEFAQAVQRQGPYIAHLAGGRELAEFARIGADASASGDLVTDAYVAATASTLGASVVTFDRDFRKFDGVRVAELTA